MVRPVLAATDRSTFAGSVVRPRNTSPMSFRASNSFAAHETFIAPPAITSAQSENVKAASAFCSTLSTAVPALPSRRTCSSSNILESSALRFDVGSSSTLRKPLSARKPPHRYRPAVP